MTGLVAKQVRAADNSTFNAWFWDDGTGNLRAVSKKLAPALVDLSQTLEGSAVTLIPAGAAPNYAYVGNPSNAAESAWINPTGGTVAPFATGCIEIPPGQFKEYPDGLGSALTAYAATPAHLVIAHAG
jgi:hypothetical protein